MSKNTFSISGDKIYITRPEWNYMACATVRDDYEEEIQNATWGLNNERYPVSYTHLTLPTILRV